MFNGLYSAATAMDVLRQQQEAIASNLAHLNTPGHRRIGFSFVERVEQGQDVEPRPGTRILEKTADFTQGRHEATGRKLDLAIGGDGFFVYQGGQGKIYSRSGVVFRNPQNNQLVNGDGLPLLGENGPITVEGPLSGLTVGADGSVQMNGAEVGKISVVQFDNNRLLESEMQTYFRAGQAVASPAENFTVQQGVRELSNAHPVTELISMIVGSRHYEASQRAIRVISESLQANVRS